MTTADIAIIMAGACYLATVGTAGAVVFRLAQQLRMAPPPKPQQADSGKNSKNSGGEGSQ